MSQPKVIHRDKLFGGRETAQEVHQRTALAGRVCICGAPASMRALSFAPVADALNYAPEYMMALARANNGQIPMLKFRRGRTDDSATEFVKIGEVCACSRCKSQLERQMAKAPSWVLVDFDYGPGEDKPQVGA